MQPLTDPIFVVAAPSAGAGLLTKLLRAASGTWSLDAAQRVAALHAFEEQEPGAPPVQAALRAIYQKPLGPPGRLVSAALHHALSIPLLRTTFPQAQFIFLHRDPAEQMAHASACGKFGMAGMRGWMARAYERTRCASAVQVEKSDLVALRWSLYTSNILHDLALLPESARCALTYAELLDDPMRVCALLGQFAGLHFAPTSQAMAGYRHHLKGQRQMPAADLPPWVDTLAAQAEAFAHEAHPQGGADLIRLSHAKKRPVRPARQGVSRRTPALVGSFRGASARPG